MSPIIAILICLVLSAFFSGMEIAFLSSNKLRIEIDKSNKSLAQTIIGYFVENSDLYITTILVGNNVVMVIYGIFFAQLLTSYFAPLGLSVGTELFVQTLISTVIILIFAEFLPKVIFRLKSNFYLKIFAIPVFLFYIIFFPISYFSVWLGKVLVRVLTGKKLENDKKEPYFNKIDLNNFLDPGDSLQKNFEEQQEIKLFRNALDFSEVRIRECIVPRTDIVALSIDSPISELNHMFVETGFSRILIFNDSIDNIVGYVHSSSLFKSPEHIESAMSSIIIVPETMPALKLMDQFIKQQKSIAVVVDEFGITAGMVTLEDIIEEIFGEIEDEHDLTHLKEEKINKTKYQFSGRLEVDYINEHYHLNLEESDEYETLAGYLLYHNSDIPAEGDEMRIGAYFFRILKVQGARIEEIEIDTEGDN